MERSSNLSETRDTISVIEERTPEKKTTVNTIGSTSFKTELKFKDLNKKYEGLPEEEVKRLKKERFDRLPEEFKAKIEEKKRSLKEDNENNKRIGLRPGRRKNKQHTKDTYLDIKSISEPSVVNEFNPEINQPEEGSKAEIENLTSVGPTSTLFRNNGSISRISSSYSDSSNSSDISPLIKNNIEEKINKFNTNTMSRSYEKLEK